MNIFFILHNFDNEHHGSGNDFSVHLRLILSITMWGIVRIKIKTVPQTSWPDVNFTFYEYALPSLLAIPVADFAILERQIDPWLRYQFADFNQFHVFVLEVQTLGDKLQEFFIHFRVDQRQFLQTVKRKQNHSRTITRMNFTLLTFHRCTDSARCIHRFVYCSRHRTMVCRNDSPKVSTLRRNNLSSRMKCPLLRLWNDYRMGSRWTIGSRVLSIFLERHSEKTSVIAAGGSWTIEAQKHYNSIAWLEHQILHQFIAVCRISQSPTFTDDQNWNGATLVLYR